MADTTSAIPAICISPALFEPPPAESPSIFSSLSMGVSNEDEGYRAKHLAPSPQSPGFARQLSPLRPADAPVTGKGLERERFEALLKTSRERNAALGNKKAVDLRKEIALKAHKTKQVERRALFLSKVLAPPSPTATHLAKTPPESPAIFHYSLPSPGYLVSPLAAFDSDDPSVLLHREPWVEQVDFRLLEPLQSKQNMKSPTLRAANDLQRLKPLPSLDQITARLSSCGQVSARHGEGAPRSTRQLPAFLQLGSRRVPKHDSTEHTTFKPRPSLPIGVGRLRTPVRTTPSSGEMCKTPHIPPPTSPSSHLSPGIQITTTVVPRMHSTSPSELSERNVNQIASEWRARKSKDMLKTLRRRTTVTPLAGHVQEGQDDDRLKRRISAPPELQICERSGFAHPVLSLPGGF